MRYSIIAYVKHILGTLRTIFWWFQHLPWGAFRQLVYQHVQTRQLARRRVRDKYTVLSHDDLQNVKNTDRVFVFGSGYSLNSINDHEWSAIAKYDTIGFSGSFHLKKVPITYHLFRGWVETSSGSQAWRREAENVCGVIKSNLSLKETVFVLQEGFSAIFSNLLLGYELLPSESRVAFFLPDKVARLPHQNMRDGLVHRMSGLCSAVSLAVALGYRDIVLTGVDLYDNRYFWAPPDKTLIWSAAEGRFVFSDVNTRGLEFSSEHNTVHNGVVAVMERWNNFLCERYGTKLSVYNPASMLATVLPTFSWDQKGLIYSE